MNAMAGILEISGVSKTYDEGGENPVKALDGVSLSVNDGEFVSIIGLSGCGKSTLFNVIGGLIPDYAGDVTIDGHQVNGTHRDVGVVF